MARAAEASDAGAPQMTSASVARAAEASDAGAPQVTSASAARAAEASEEFPKIPCPWPCLVCGRRVADWSLGLGPCNKFHVVCWRKYEMKLENLDSFILPAELEEFSAAWGVLSFLASPAVPLHLINVVVHTGSDSCPWKFVNIPVSDKVGLLEREMRIREGSRNAILMTMDHTRLDSEISWGNIKHWKIKPGTAIHVRFVDPVALEASVVRGKKRM